MVGQVGTAGGDEWVCNLCVKFRFNNMYIIVYEKLVSVDLSAYSIPIS